MLTLFLPPIYLFVLYKEASAEKQRLSGGRSLLQEEFPKLLPSFYKPMPYQKRSKAHDTGGSLIRKPRTTALLA